MTPWTAVQLTRGVTATWWYTFGAVVWFDLMVPFIWWTLMIAQGQDRASAWTVGIVGLVWVATMIPLLLDYRNRRDIDSRPSRPAVVLAAVGSVAFGIVGGLLAASWLLAVAPALTALMMLRWSPGVRLRMTIAVTLVLIALWVIDSQGASWALAPTSPLAGFFTALLPFMTVTSLWWWDVLSTLDLARASESRLAATQERLRVATDVHDLQGHHLQVIALQLELAERLMGSDDAAALEQLRAARASVAEARQGTRDLATRFRSVPLSDELANAVDILRAAGIDARRETVTDTSDAPASVLGPVIREATTNILRHGSGKWARLALVREAGDWVLQVSNDAPAGVEAGSGSGLDGIRRRVGEHGGLATVERTDDTFVLTVSVPAATGEEFA